MADQRQEIQRNQAAGVIAGVKGRNQAGGSNAGLASGLVFPISWLAVSAGAESLGLAWKVERWYFGVRLNRHRAGEVLLRLGVAAQPSFARRHSVSSIGFAARRIERWKIR